MNQFSLDSIQSTSRSRFAPFQSDIKRLKLNFLNKKTVIVDIVKLLTIPTKEHIFNPVNFIDHVP